MTNHLFGDCSTGTATICGHCREIAREYRKWTKIKAEEDKNFERGFRSAVRSSSKDNLRTGTALR